MNKMKSTILSSSGNPKCRNYTKVFVGRHKALYEYCKEIGIIDNETPFYRRVNINKIRGKEVVGTLPLELASYAKKYTEIPLKCHAEPGLELTIEDIRMSALAPRTYKIFLLDESNSDTSEIAS